MLGAHHPMTIYLSGPALDRLIGGDTEAEVKIRYAIMENYARTRIKAFINDTTIAHLQKVWEEDWAKVISDVIKDYRDQKDAKADAAGRVQNEYTLRWRVDEVVKKLMEDEGAKHAADKIKDAQYKIDATVRRYEDKLLAEANQRVKQVIDTIDAKMEERIDAAFERRVQAEVDRRLKVAAAVPPE